MHKKEKKVIIAAGIFASGYAMAKGIAGKKTEDYESLNADNPYIKIYQAGQISPLHLRNNLYQGDHPRSYGECHRVSCLPVDYPYMVYWSCERCRLG